MKLSIIRGDTLIEPFSVKLPSGAAVSLTGATLTFTVKSQADALDAAAEFQGTNPSTVQITNAAGGLGQIVMTAAQTAALVVGQTYYYDLQMVDGSGNVTTLMIGTLHVKRDITRTPNP